MTPSARRFLITIVITVVAGALLSLVLFTPKVQPPAATTPPNSVASNDETAAEQSPDTATPERQSPEAQQPDAQNAEAPTQDTEPPATTPPDASDPSATGDVDVAQNQDETQGADVASAGGLSKLSAIPSPRGRAGADVLVAADGSLDPRSHLMQVDYSLIGGGIRRISLADIWLTARARHQAERHYAALAKGAATVPPLPADDMHYVLMESQPLSWNSPTTGELHTIDLPVLAAHSIIVEGQTINLANAESWSETGVGEFESVIVDGEGKPVLTITRTFTLGDNYDILLSHRFTNHLDRPLDIKWRQYGPGDLFVDRARYIDRRRLRFGYLLSPAQDPARQFPLLDSNMLLERSKVLRLYKKVESGSLTPAEVDQTLTLWPNDESKKNGYELSSFTTTNRYFAISVHPHLDAQGRGNKYFSDVVDEIRFMCTDTDARSVEPSIITYLYSPTLTVPANNAANPLTLDYGVYAGPLDRHILDNDPRYKALNLRGLILYQISSLCGFCTFQWLAILLLKFLSLVEAITLDWGVAIILLVMVVRACLHPLTKRSQINMQRFGKQMQVLKPELDKLKSKYGDDPKRMQQEQMRLWKENGVNPLQMLGCVPMFLQTPIWIALYATLYLAFDLRQQPAFYGIFQHLTGGSWRFLADLSAADHFFYEFVTPRHFLLWNLTGINLLPLLMGVIFFIQQKYMSPPPNPTTTKEQLNQQRIMKVMMVVMFPLMLYSAPSGLTLYILTSSTIGIIESRYVRAHINELDLNPPKPKKKSSPRGAAGGKKKKPKDPQGRAFADALERAKTKGKPAPSKYKRRK